MDFDTLESEKLVQMIREGVVGVLPTDTLYGLHTSAFNPASVERIYSLKKRDPAKPFIVLVSALTDLEMFGIDLDPQTRSFLENLWPNPVSVVLSCSEPKLKYLHRGTNSLAFRMPKKTDLLSLLTKTGPLVSTTVNLEGAEPAKTIAEAKEIFDEKLDFFVDVGRLESASSTLIKFEAGKPVVLRQGDFKIPNTL